ncbi:MAG: aminoacyl-tRNA hydrolase [Phycisphaerales bacterium]
MKLVVGLGNPGPAYEATRHNVGFDVLGRLARRHAPGESARSRFHSVLIETIIGPEKVLLMQPTTFMNRSGTSVSEAVNFYKLDPAEDVLVVVDDIALPCGSFRLRGSGSAGGHNGLSDIQRRIGTDAFARLRIGIDRPGEIPQKDYVLGRFRPDQREAMEPALDECTDAAACWVTEGLSVAMNRFNRKQTA